jgi:hypothetical protein
MNKKAKVKSISLTLTVAMLFFFEVSATSAISPIAIEVMATHEGSYGTHLKVCDRKLCVAGIKIKNRWIFAPASSISSIMDADINSSTLYVDESTGRLTSIYIVVPVAESDTPRSKRKCPSAIIRFDSKKFVGVSQEFRPPC